MGEEAPPSQRSSTCIWSLIVGLQAGSWAGRLVESYLGPEERLALFQTCQASRDMMLSTAGYLTMTLALQADDPGRELRRLRVLRPAFQTRAALDSKLECKLQCAALWPLTQALGVLAEAGQWLNSLAVDYPAGTLPTSTVAEIGRSFPNLKYLAIDGRLEGMPDPELFSQLEDWQLYVSPAGVDISLDHLFVTLQPYLPCLKRLGMRTPTSPRISDPLVLLLHLPLLFPPNPLPRLKVLHLAIKLDDDLLGLLLEKVPALQTFTVATVQLQSDIHALATCAWQYFECEHDMHLSSLARLPLPAGVKVIVSALVCDVVTDQAQAALRAAVAKATMRTEHCVRLEPMANLDVDLQPTALRVALDMLRSTTSIEDDCPLIDMRVELCRWLLSDRIIRELRGLPHWGSLMLWRWGRPVGHSCMCTTLLRCLPTSFHTVVLPANEPMIEAVCWGAPIDRTAEEPFHIRLYGNANRIQSVMAALQHSVALPHVIVSPDNGEA